MKDIKSILEGLFSKDVTDLKGYEPIEIPEMEAQFRAFALVKEHIRLTNNAVKEQLMLARLNELKSVLDEFTPEELEEAEATAKAVMNRKKADMWHNVRGVKSYLTQGFKVEEPEALDNYSLWAGFAKVIKELFQDSQVKKYFLSGSGIFYFEDGEVFWYQNKKTTENVDAVVKKIQKILPSNLVSITQEENQNGPEIHFDPGVLSDY